MRRNPPSRAQVQCWTVPQTHQSADLAVTPGAPAKRDPLHGHTLATIDHLARLVMRTDRWHTAGDIDERFDTIRHAIIEHLLTHDTPPDRHALLAAGTRASDAAVYDHARTHGRNISHPGKAMPAFHRFWENALHRGASPETRVVEVLAFVQIWPLLRPSEQRAFTALAATGDHEKAAAMCGVAYGTFRALVSTGRRRFLEFWHEGETPSRVWRTDRRVCSRDGRDPLGRLRLTGAQVDEYRERYERGETLRSLAGEAGLSATGLSRLLRGVTRPAGVC